MDRLLTDEEIRGIVQNTPAGVYDYKAVAQAQDDLTAHLVAQEIISKFNTIYYYGACVHPAIREDEEVYIIRKQDWEVIKSKWGIE